MKERILAEENRILEVITGSFLYGTNIDSSDKDRVGIFLPSEEYILGFKTVEEVDFSIIDKDESKKNTEKALDRKLYEMRKFVKLALENNPNILELLFVNDENIVFINDVGKELLSMNHYFPYKGLKERFLGYAFSQKHKMIIKKDNYFDLISTLDYLRKFDLGKLLLEICLDSKCPPFIKKKYNQINNIVFIEVGDLNLNPSCTIKRANIIISERLSKVGNREELLTKYGFDVKFGMHLVRLMLEGIELLKTGGLQFPLTEAPLLMDIRNGKWSIEQILNFSYELEKEIESLVENSKLPSKPNYEILEQFTIKTLKKMIL